MKKRILAAVALAALTATAAFAGQPARTGITDSVHDMNIYSGATPDEFGRSCVFCHTPHNAQPIDPLNPVPLWNHEWSTADFSAGVYQWATPENLPLAIADPLIGPTRLCLSCHDGTVAVDQHGPSRAFAGSVMLTGDAAVGLNADLTDDHPIGFSYDQALTERNVAGLLADSYGYEEVVGKAERFASAVTASTVGGTYDAVVREEGSRTIGDVLYQGDIFTCASCHEVHNKENVVQDTGTLGYQPNYLLYARETDSLICLSCHVK